MDFRVIKLSSPNLNYMIGSGAILLYISIILVAIPLPNANMATSLCLVTPWFTAIGFSLCYGTILAKMLRIWYIFHNPVVKKKQVLTKSLNNRARVAIPSTQVHDWMLVLLVMCLVVSDVVILAVYTGLEASQGAASLVPNRENEITISRVRLTLWYRCKKQGSSRMPPSPSVSMSAIEYVHVEHVCQPRPSPRHKLYA